MDPSQFAGFASDRGIRVSDRDIRQLWSLGVLRADLVASRSALRTPGLKRLCTDPRGWCWYADHRRLALPPLVFPTGLQQSATLPPGVALAFHPFRYYLLHRLSRALEPPIALLQPIFGPEHYLHFATEWLDSLKRWLSAARTLEAVERWHNLAELTIALEPVFYERLFGVRRASAGVSLAAKGRTVERYWRGLRPHLERVEIRDAEDARRELIFEARCLDTNTDLHVLIRLADAQLREQLKDQVGGATLLLTMAELIRRAVEEVRGVSLPEEDALAGSRALREHAKQRLFGSRRLLDDDRAAREFIRHHNLHPGVRLRWYVEGDTEAAIVRELLLTAGSAGIEVLNLRGAFVQNRSLAFQDSLREDLRLGIFSFISLDGDKSENLRAVRRAAQDDLICGRVFISDPDVEMGNFSHRELAGALWAARAEGTPPALRKRLAAAIAKADSGKAVMRFAQHALHPHLSGADKGDAWGRRLAAIAAQKPFRRGRTLRPIAEAVRLAVAFPRQSHDWTLREYRIDPTTLQPVKRASGS